jgi:RNA polymerase sigma-70 factor (ECF subfamily)
VNKHHQTENDINAELRQIKAAQDNPEKFSILYEKYFKAVFVFIHRRTGNEDLTADLTSQVFLKALINIKKYTFKGVPFSGWLFRIAFNEVNMFYRKNNAVRRIGLEQEGICQIAQETDVTDNQEAVSLMTRALKNLNEDEIQMIELRYFEKYSFAEVASIVGITENNAKVKVYRIIDKIKRFMKL